MIPHLTQKKYNPILRQVLSDERLKVTTTPSTTRTSSDKPISHDVRRSALETDGQANKGEQKVLDAVKFARTVLDRTTASSACSKSMFRFGPWVSLPMAVIREAERGMMHPYAMHLERFVIDSVLSKDIDIEEREEMYDGAKQDEFKRFQKRHMRQFALDAIHSFLLLGYAPYVAVPHDKFGMYPKVLSVASTKHDFRESPTATEFRITFDEAALEENRGKRVGSGFALNVVSFGSDGGIDALTSYPIGVRNAFAIGPDGKEAPAAASLPFLAPVEAVDGDEVVFRLKPRIFVKVLDRPPSVTTGVFSRIFAARKAVQRSEFFIKNAIQNEQQKRRQMFMASVPPPQRPDLHTQMGSVMGAAQAAALCPSVDAAQAYRAGLNSTGTNGAAAAGGGAVGSFSALHNHNMRAGAISALRYGDMALLHGDMQANLYRRGLMARRAGGEGGGGDGDGDDYEITPNDGSAGGGGSRYANGIPVYDLRPGEKLETLPAATTHDDPVRFSEELMIEQLSNAIGIPTPLFRRPPHSGLGTGQSREDDSNNFVWRRNIARIAMALREMMEDAYRQCYLVEFASRIPGRPYKPGPGMIRIREEEKARDASRHGAGKNKRQVKAKARNVIREQLRVVVRRRALRRLINETTQDMTRMIHMTTQHACELDTENSDGAVSDWSASSSSSGSESDSESSSNGDNDSEADSGDDDGKDDVIKASRAKPRLKRGVKRKRSDDDDKDMDDTGDGSSSSSSTTKKKKKSARVQKKTPKPKRPTRKPAKKRSRGTSKEAKPGQMVNLPPFQVPPEQRATMLEALAKQLRNASNDSKTADACVSWLDGLFGNSARFTDIEALVRLIHSVEQDMRVPLEPVEKSIEDRIRDMGIVVSFPAMKSFAAVAFVQEQGFLRPGAYPRAVNEEHQIPLADMWREPHFPEQAAAAASGGGGGKSAAGKKKAPAAKKNGARGLSRRMATVKRLVSKSPSTKKDGTPDMPLINANKKKPAARDETKKTKPNNKKPASDADDRKKKKKKKVPVSKEKAGESSDSDDDSTDKEPGQPKKSKAKAK